MSSTQSSPRSEGTPQERTAPKAEEKPERPEGSEASASSEKAGKAQASEKSAGAEKSESAEKSVAEERPEADASEAPAAAGGVARATMVYTMMRLGLFVGCFFLLSVLAWVGVIPEGIGTSNPLWLFALAILISAPLSLVLLRKQRDAMSETIVPKVERASSNFKGRLENNRGREDDVA